MPYYDVNFATSNETSSMRGLIDLKNKMNNDSLYDEVSAAVGHTSHADQMDLLQVPLK